MIDLDQLEALADQKERLEGLIERGFWCLNLLLLDAISREELEQLRREVTAFSWQCRNRNDDAGVD
jgi:hypothetical protein